MKPISFLINTSINTLDHLKLLLRSLRENLHSKDHEILIFVDSDNEGTYEYLKAQKQHFNNLRIITHDLKPCIGYSRNNNLLVELASNEIVTYLQSDMVVCKDYDLNVLEDLEENCVLSITRIEPPLHGSSETTITQNFGVDPNQFDWDGFINFSNTKKQDKQLQYFFAPFVFHKSTWLSLGGYDTMYRRSREDSDLLQRFIHAGVKIKQTFKANVYHFSCVTSRGKNWFDQSNASAQERVKIQGYADRVELRRFIRRWGGFNHGEQKLRKYDVDLVIKGEGPFNYESIINIEPFFSRVWISSHTAINHVCDVLDVTEHTYANMLLNFTEDDWKIASKYYNQTDYSSIFLYGSPENWNVKIEINCSLLSSNTFVTTNPQTVYDVIDATEEGQYETEDGVVIDIKTKLYNVPNLRVENPPFDMNLLHIE